MKKTLCILFCLAAVASSLSCSRAAPQEAAAPAGLTLAENGRSPYVIALAEDAIPAEATAAKELQSYFEQITGVQLAIKKENEVAASLPQILVGPGKRAKKLVSPQAFNSLENDGIILKTVEGKLVLAGARPRGTLYAVYEFLEKNAGVRWWTPTESRVPVTKTLRIPALNTSYSPPFFYRENYTRDVQYQESLFATRMRENGHFQTQGEKLGGHYSLIGWCHTSDLLLPPQKYFKAHPEWYSDVKNGNKPCTAASVMPLPQTSQLNYTNDEMRRELTKNALELIRKNPRAGIISITQNDNYNYCRSAGDMAVIEREGSPSGPLIQFVNKVAADIEKEFPNFLVETLAYSHTRKPPRTVKPRGNVVIRLCSIEADFARPLDSEANADFRADMTSWRKIAPHLYVWDYMTNFINSIWPHPNLRVLGPNLRYFAKEKVGSVFEQGDSYSNGTGDFVQLRTWLVSKLLWDPQQDENKLIDEFLAGYYGAAAPHLHAYLDTIQDAFLANKGRLATAQADSNYLSYDVVSAAWRDFEAAQKAVAGNAVLSARVRRERLVLDNVIINRYPQLRRDEQLKLALQLGADSPQTIRPFLPHDLPAFAAEFVKTAHFYKVDQYKEGVAFSEYETILKNRLAAPAPLPSELRATLGDAEKAGRVIDVLEDQIRFFDSPNSTGPAEDTLASNGKAARIIGNTDGWNLQYPIEESREVLTAAPWRIYAVARIETAPGAQLKATAFSSGIYDDIQKKGRLSADISLDGPLADGQYHLLDLGKAQLDSGCYFYISGPNRPDIKNIYIDRLIFVRDPLHLDAPLPKELRQPLAEAAKAGRVIDVQEDKLSYSYGETIAAEESDPLASNGHAGRIIGNTDTWAQQYEFEQESAVLTKAPWHAYAVVRVALNPGAQLRGQAFVAGIYDRKKAKQKLYFAKELQDGLTDGKYHVIDLGEASLDRDCYFYLAGPKRADIAAIYLDRVIFVQNP